MKRPEEPIRVLHVVGRLDLGGAESRLMDLYRTMDREKVQFDFMVHTPDRCDYEEEAESLGSRIYRMPRFRFWNYFAYRKAWRDFFLAHREFSAVQGHMTSTAAIYLPIAKKAGVSKTIAHARSAGVEKGTKGLLTKLLRRSLAQKCDACFSCSELASKAVFGKKAVSSGRVRKIPNAIETAKFRFDPEVRERMRKQLGLTDAYVLGHVGRLSPVKNHSYLFAVLQALLVKKPEAKLLLVGGGPLEQELKEKAAALGLSDQVVFAGPQKKVEEYYQAMDFFVLPSFYEGLPGSVVEAQASGLRCLVSDTVTKETALTVLVQFASVAEPPVQWAERIMSRADYERADMTAAVAAEGYDVKTQAEWLQDFYLGGEGI